MTTAKPKDQKASELNKKPKKFAKDIIIDFIIRSLNPRSEARLSYQDIESATGFSQASITRTIRFMRKQDAVWHIESGTGQKNDSPSITLFKRL